MGEGRYWNRTSSSVHIENTRASTQAALNEISEWYYNQTGEALWLTSGNDSDVHSSSASGRGSHYDGDKFDIASDRLESDTVLRQGLIQFAESRGITILDEYSNPSPNSTGGHLDVNAMNFISGYNRPHVLPKGHGEFTKKVPEEYQAKFLEKTSFLTKTKDKFLNSWVDAGVLGDARLVWKNIEANGLGTDTFTNWNPTEEDKAFVEKALPDDDSARKFVLLNASSPQNLALLVQMKQEDVQRKARVENYKGAEWAEGTMFEGIGLSTIGTVAGAILDPVNLIPFAGTGYKGYSLGAKTLARLGNYAPRLDKVVRYGTKAGVNYTAFGAANTAERYWAERSSGYEQDYKAAFFIGGAFSVLAPAAVKGLQRLAKFNNRGAQKMVGALDEMENHAIAQAMDAPLPSAVRPMLQDIPYTILDSAPTGKAKRSKQYEKATKMLGKREKLSPIEEFEKTLQMQNDPSKLGRDISPKAAQAFKSGKVAVISKEDIPKLAANLKQPINSEAKAFHHVPSGRTVLIAENIKSTDNVENILAHEMGVHSGLKKTLGDQYYGKLQSYVENQIKNPKTDDWLLAVRKTPSGGWEEVLGHWVEAVGLDTPIGKKLTQGLRSQLRALGMQGKLTDVDVKRAVKESLDHEISTSRGWQTNPDGSVVMNDLKYSAQNIFNPNFIEGQVNLNPLAESQEGMGKFKRVGQFMEDGWLFRTYFGALKNSKSPFANKISGNLTSDARNRGYKGDLVMPVEEMAKDLIGQLHKHVTAYWEVRNQAVFNHLLNYLQPKAKMQEFNRDVIECYNATYTTNRSGLSSTLFRPEVQEAAAIVKNFRDAQVELGKTSSSRFGTKGKNLIDDDWIPTDDELWRLVDDDKFLNFVRKFPDQPKAIEFLSEYAYKAAKRDLLKGRLLREMNAEALEKWKKAGRFGNPPQPLQDVPADVLDNYIRQESKDWATGIIDQDISNMNYKDTGVHDQSNLFHQRFPMDTTMIMDTPFGDKFSFDVALRDTDLDRMMLRSSRRLSGEAALNNLFKSPDDFIMAKQQLISDLDRGIQYQQITHADKKRQLKAYDEVIRQIRGVGSPEDVKGIWDATAALLTRLSYAQNGANMGLNQLGEVGGAMGYTGGEALTHLFPTSVGRYINSMRRGKATQEMIEDVEWQVFGEMVESRVFSNASSYESRVIKDATTFDAQLRHLDKVGTGLNYASKIVTFVNRLPVLTERMIRGARQDIIAKTVKWSVGEKTHIIGDPFSAKKLKAAGIEGGMVDAVKADLRTYTKRGADGKPKSLEANQWRKDNPTTFYKWKYLVENHGRRAIQQDTIGNKNMLKDANFFTRLMFQFKDFSLKAVNGQTMRALTHREADDLLAALFSMGTNAMVYAGLTHAKAYVYFGDDETKRQEYIDQRLSWEQIFYAGLFRGAISGSALSFGRDIYEAATGSQSYRTTVDRTGNFGKDPEFRDMAGDFIAQLPAARSFENIVKGFGSLYEVFTSDERELTERDLKTLYKSFPLQNYVPLQWFLNETLEQLDLPKK